MKQRRYTQQEVTFLTECVVGRSYAEVADLFNLGFAPSITAEQAKRFCSNRKLRTGRDARFKPGHTPFNKGKQGVNGSNSTCFKKGHRPQTWRPVGSERINREGLIEVKVAEPKMWKAKQRVLWESLNGDIPKGHVVLFADRNPRNFAPENLLCVSRRELALLNKNRLIKADTDLTRAGTTLVKLMLVTSARKKELQL